jgi:hypothetical protein
MAGNVMWLSIGIMINLSHTKKPHQNQHHKSPCLWFHQCPPYLYYSYFYQHLFDAAQTYAFCSNNSNDCLGDISCSNTIGRHLLFVLHVHLLLAHQLVDLIAVAVAVAVAVCS